MFYVYRHIRNDTNTPFYVGKGVERNRRAVVTQGRNTYWKNIVRTHGYRVEIVKRFDNETEALNFEAQLIRQYKIFGLCEANFVNYDVIRSGAAGHRWTAESRAKAAAAKIGTTASSETRAKMSTSQSGVNNAFFGKFHSEEFKSHLSRRHRESAQFAGHKNPAARSVVDLKSGKMYRTLREAAIDTGVFWITVSRHCRDLVKSPRFRYGEFSA